MPRGKKLTRQQRDKIADKVMTWANMVFAGMGIAQIFSKPFHAFVGFAGAVLFVGAYLLAVWIMRGGGSD